MIDYDITMIFEFDGFTPHLYEFSHKLQKLGFYIYIYILDIDIDIYIYTGVRVQGLMNIDGLMDIDGFTVIKKRSHQGDP